MTAEGKPAETLMPKFAKFTKENRPVLSPRAKSLLQDVRKDAEAWKREKGHLLPKMEGNIQSLNQVGIPAVAIHDKSADAIGKVDHEVIKKSTSSEGQRKETQTST